jgi:hypothetical protein
VNTFELVPRDVRQDQADREMLLAKPPEFFRAALGGNPNPLECAHLVESIVRTLGALKIYVNDTYRVRVRRTAPYIHIAIGRHDHQPCTNWRDFQRIKNELVGPEYEAVELFPAESRLMDTENEYHLYVLADPQQRFPFGFERRAVMESLGENDADHRDGARELTNRQERPALSMDGALTALGG